MTEIKAVSEIVKQLFDSCDTIDYGYKLGLSVEAMKNSNWFDDDLLEEAFEEVEVE